MTTHIVRPYETLPAIAARYYGASGRWRDLVVANDLRAPYLSDDALDQLGVMQAATTLAAVASPGDHTLALVPVGASILRAGVTLVLTRMAATTGLFFRDIVIADSVQGGAVTLTTGLVYGYALATQVGIYPPASELSGSVLATGDILYVPDVALLPVTPPPGAVFGSDLAVGSDGQLALTETGGYALAASDANLIQAIALRLKTTAGSLARAPNYGLGIGDIVGAPLTPDALAHIVAWVELTVIQDPRVRAVESVSVTTDSDTVTISVVVDAVEQQATITVEY